MLGVFFLLWLSTISRLPVAGVADLVIYDYQMMDSAGITTEEEVPNICMCKAKCYVDPVCQAVSTEVVDKTNKCYFSSHVGMQTRLRKANDSYVTYVKKGCGPGFEIVNKLCYFFSVATADHDGARQTCPAGSELAYPATSGEMDDLKTHLGKYKADVEKWYVDATLAENGKWYWSNNEEVTGQGLMASKGQPCAMLKATQYAMINTACTEALNFICQHAKQD
ncbi:C-type lectin-like [Trinorchestia longiramus]|nr:C-type lectin-like [Trinorchestia longiramus]